MALTNDPVVNAAIDRLCGDGCRTVRARIQALERGEPGAAPGMNVEQRTLLLAELRAIMAVYGEQCPLPDDSQ